MQVNRPSPPFTPVTITLESQEEVNELYALLAKEELCPVGSHNHTLQSLLRRHRNYKNYLWLALELSERIKKMTTA